VSRFVYLKPALSFVLIFVGLKMALVDVYKLPVAVSLGVVGVILAIGVTASLLRTRSAAPSPSGSAGSTATRKAS